MHDDYPRLGSWQIVPPTWHRIQSSWLVTLHTRCQSIYTLDICELNLNICPLPPLVLDMEHRYLLSWLMRHYIKLRLFSPCIHPRKLRSGTPNPPGDHSNQSAVAILHRHQGAATVALAITRSVVRIWKHSFLNSTRGLGYSLFLFFLFVCKFS